MRQTESKPRIALALLTVLPFLVVLTGCGKKDEADSEATPAGTKKTASAGGGGGKAIYVANNCANCHSIGGEGGKKAPDLSHAGAAHDAAWFAEFVKNPSSKKPGSRMPAFAGKINDKDLATLGSYLASLK